MDMVNALSPLHTAILYVGVLVILMLGLKLYVGNRRAKHKVPSGDLSNAEFNRATRVQLNAVEDVPILAVGILGLGMLGMPPWYIHMAGLVLVVARIAHAAGLAGSGGFSIGRLIGAFGSVLSYLIIGGALLVHAFNPPA